MERVVKVPEEFWCAPFFRGNPNGMIYNTEQSFEETIQNTYFLFDIEKDYKPWNEMEKTIPVVLNEWKGKQEDIATLFRNRKKEQAEAPMIHFAAHMLSILYWLNEQPVCSLNDIKANTDKLEIQPVNFMERYSFIIKKPGHYHSYIQLVQLYIEIEKLFAKRNVIKKKSPSH
ncbi:GTPase [Bacillus clarus]|uniref:GTPase n=1 Tax=Bacillus clarus TaxID=2338372 RepID=A0A090YTI2_9BACI|nr:hypothetical protein [Bacillus clarus]KFN01720.1 hypothetical protein DJ93_4018 [Bacillus clarus]RFT68408.1 GTPase [Bacillus clarus]